MLKYEAERSPKPDPCTRPKITIYGWSTSQPFVLGIEVIRGEHGGRDASGEESLMDSGHYGAGIQRGWKRGGERPGAARNGPVIRHFMSK
jgi:hypothetical protein